MAIETVTIRDDNLSLLLGAEGSRMRYGQNQGHPNFLRLSILTGSWWVHGGVVHRVTESDEWVAFTASPASAFTTVLDSQFETLYLVHRNSDNTLALVRAGDYNTADTVIDDGSLFVRLLLMKQAVYCFETPGTNSPPLFDLSGTLRNGYSFMVRNATSDSKIYNTQGWSSVIGVNTVVRPIVHPADRTPPSTGTVGSSTSEIIVRPGAILFLNKGNDTPTQTGFMDFFSELRPPIHKAHSW